MVRKLSVIVSFAMLLFAFGCNKGEGTKTETAKTEPEATETTMPADTTAQTAEPDYISVQHILIGFAGSVPGKDITRTQEEAGALAAELLGRAQGGEDFDALVQEYTNDAYPGIYQMANFTAQADMANKIYPRAEMVPAFGDTGFPMAVGGIGMAAYDPQKSPYGWHIVKRVE